MAVCASAQFPPGFKMPSLQYNPALLALPTVQQDMHLNPEVAKKIQAVVMEQGMKMLPALMGAMGGKKNGPPVDQKKMLNDLMASYDVMQKETLKYLTPPQRTRLHEITLQVTGPAALLDPKVATEIGLTSKQTSQIQTAIASSAHRPKGGRTGMGAADMQSMMATQKKSKEDLERSLATILTPSQKAKWKRLQGRPLPLSGALGGFGGGFGGR